MSSFIKFFEKSTLDMPQEKQSAIETYTDYILNGRQLMPSMRLYSPSDKMLCVQGKPFHSEEEHSQQIISMMMLASAAKAESILLTFGYDVEYADGVVRHSIVTVLANYSGSIAEPFSYTIENQNVVFDETLELPEGKICYPSEINDILAMGMKINRPVDKPSVIANWLHSENYDIQFNDEYSIDTIDYITFSV